MESMLPLLLQVVLGGLGGNGIARVVKRVDQGTMGNTIVGAIGGLLCSAIAGPIPGINMLGELGLLGDGVTGLAGGVAATTLFGYAQKFLQKNSAD